MKNLILGIGLLVFAGVATVSCNDDDDHQVSIVEINTLPTSALEFLATYFSDVEIFNIEKYAPVQSNGAMYEVNFRNGSEIEFDQAGNWIKVEATDRNVIPTGFILPSIVAYTTTNYPTEGINQIEKTPTGFEVELTNDLDLIFDANGQFVRINP
ncbi:PepSY-like domain-containing protein [Faecalibacter sp. LW9]|uniref:PepSY-like domain-containing protein n=1 Tax=Faecalibacter sp. LW9 TaxID=3103144 RepID=UPI002B0026C2|nr:PepSY-like domain-containing protein [Faecalibacter sp. LW9]